MFSKRQPESTRSQDRKYC